MAVKLEQAYDLHGRRMIRATKKRGKISVAEIQDAMRDKRIEGVFCIIFGAGYDGYQWDAYDEDDGGDVVDIQIVEEECTCPICGRDEPITRYCPNCGEFVNRRRDLRI